MKLCKEKSFYSSKNDFFLAIFTSFILDNQKYVRSATLEIFGKFIFELDKQELNQIFFDFYKNILEQYYFNIREFGIETEQIYYSNVNIKFNFS